ncbi:glycosyltransferase [Kaistella sp. PBT33-4]|uniref:glycosyltransferase family 2 protein n=1 Tax=Kaistella sp. PBT33-4 TaxID=3032000 RepID=UPI0023D8963C|nr:glycosyltransferase [Kaistella sp. PBT33-4]MDF0718815.1 glycosyltransferase [Kaistella sp. PBT33-4]
MKNEKLLPLVTVGIPLYNAEKFISLAIKSVLSQTYGHFELIITDDGSTDDSVKIVQSFKDDRIQLLSDGRNFGLPYRLNQQIGMAQGKFFVRMDADDIMFPDRLEKQIDYLQKHPNIDAVGSSVVIVDDDNQAVAFRKAELLSEYRQLFRTILFNHPTVAGKTAFFKENPYSEQYDGVEDAELWLRTFQNGNFGILEEPLLFYRDPLIFKLKTYRYRLTQKNRLFRNSDYLRNYKLLRLALIAENKLKIVVASLLTRMNKGRWVISRRNTANYEVSAEWKSTLREIVNGK